MGAEIGAAMNKTAIHQVTCYRRNRVNSGGIWERKNPLSFALPLLLAQISLISAVAGAMHSLLRRAGQSNAVSQIAAGAVLGFSRGAALFPPQSRIPLDVLSGMGVMLFLFMIGVKTDLRTIVTSGGEAAALAFSATVVPSAFMFFSGVLVELSTMPAYSLQDFVFKLAGIWSITSYTVLSCVLDELNLLNSKLGRLALSATLIAEFTSIVLGSVVSQIKTLEFTAFFSFMGFIGFIFLIARPITLWIISKTPKGELIEEGYLLVVLAMTVACGLISEVIGHNAATGTFLLGLALPGGAPLGATLERKLDAMVSGILVPLFMGYAGFKINVDAISDGPRCRRTVLFLLLGGVGKAVGVLLPCIYFKIPLPDAMILALMMNTRGIFEVYILDGFLGHDNLNEETYSLVVLCVVGFSVVTNLVLKLTYIPSLSYSSVKRRTIQHSRREAELRVLVCIRNEDDVFPMVELLESLHATGESPLCVYVLHVLDFAGRTAATLAEYKKPKGPPGGAASATDHIMNVFHFFQEENEGSVLVLPFICASPPATIYEDVCALAMEKKVSFVVLPFHKKLAIDGSVETDPSMKTTNTKTLSYSPCSVGILVGAGAGEVLRRVAVYFLGGADDREALAFAMRASENPSAYVTAIRFRLPERIRERDSEEEAMDDEAVREFRMSAVQSSERVSYREEVVKDGKEMMGLIRSLSGYFSLLVVGRKKGEESPLTQGLSTLTDYPELGALGGVLASVDFGSAVSLLVVQQQREKLRRAEVEPTGEGILGGFLSRHRHSEPS